jgi:LysR family nitrogen assimilation transcriptional regulator
LPLILPSRPHGLRLLIDQVLSGAGISANVELEVDALPATIKLAEKRVGYTIHSYSLAHDLIEEGRIQCWPIVEPRLTRQLIMATSSQRPTTTATRALTNMVRSQVRELARQAFGAHVRFPERRRRHPPPIRSLSRASWTICSRRKGERRGSSLYGYDGGPRTQGRGPVHDHCMTGCVAINAHPR